MGGHRPGRLRLSPWLVGATHHLPQQEAHARPRPATPPRPTLQALCSVVWTIHKLELGPSAGWTAAAMRQARRRLPAMASTDLALLLMVGGVGRPQARLASCGAIHGGGEPALRVTGGAALHQQHAAASLHLGTAGLTLGCETGPAN